jgi:N-acyl-D-amino-acid deacylase
VRTKSTVQQPRAYPEGIQLVVVNGTVAVKNGEHSGSMTGKVLRRS